MTPPGNQRIAGRPVVPGQPPAPTAETAAARAAEPGEPAAAQASQVAGPPWLSAIPAAVTLAVVLWGIQRPSYWRDEAATLAAVHRSFAALLRLLSNNDAVHGVYYMMIWADARLAGTGELATRLPSALAMAVAAAGVAAIGRRLISPRAGLFAGLIFAVLPEVSWYGQDARSYALVTALAVVAGYLLARVLGCTGPRRRWLAGYALALTAAGLVNIFALALIPAHGLTVALALRGQPGRPDRRALLAGWLAAAAAAVIAASPVIALAWAQRGQERWLKPPGLRTLAALRYLVGPPPLAVVVLLVIGGGIAVSAAGGRARSRADWPASLPALCLPWLLLPAAILLAGSLIQPVYTLRYVLFSLPALALLAGAALAALGQRPAPPPWPSWYWPVSRPRPASGGMPRTGTTSGWPTPSWRPPGSPATRSCTPAPMPGTWRRPIPAGWPRCATSPWPAPRARPARWPAATCRPAPSAAGSPESAGPGWSGSARPARPGCRCCTGCASS